MVPPPITPDSESDTELDVLQGDFLPQYSPHTPENLIVFRAEDQQVDRQQWHLLCAFPDNTLTSRELQDGARTSPTQVHMSQRAAAVEEEEKVKEESEDIPSLKPPPVPAMPEAICLMVEDPYFDTPMSSPSSEEVPAEPAEDTKDWTFSPIFNTPLLCVNNQNLTSPVSGICGHICQRQHSINIYFVSLMCICLQSHPDEEAPPPLPERTAASYELALDTGLCFSIKTRCSCADTSSCLTFFHFVFQSAHIPLKGYQSSSHLTLLLRLSGSSGVSISMKPFM